MVTHTHTTHTHTTQTHNTTQHSGVHTHHFSLLLLLLFLERVRTNFELGSRRDITRFRFNHLLVVFTIQHINTVQANTCRIRPILKKCWIFYRKSMGNHNFSAKKEWVFDWFFFSIFSKLFPFLRCDLIIRSRNDGVLPSIASAYFLSSSNALARLRNTFIYLGFSSEAKEQSSTTSSQFFCERHTSNNTSQRTRAVRVHTLSVQPMSFLPSLCNKPLDFLDRPRGFLRRPPQNTTAHPSTH